MNQLGIALVMMGIAAMGITAPTSAMGDTAHTSAMTNDRMSGDIPHLVMTIVCTIYSDQLGEAMSGMDLAMGINLGQYMHGCEMTTEYVDEPAVVVDISEGALFPACVDSNDCFDPPNVTVTAGTDVTWTNSDTVLHTVTEQNGLFNGWLQPGEEFTFTFDAPGTYMYTCTVHPWSTGMVTVEPSDDSMQAQTTSYTFPTQKLVEELIEMYDEKGTAVFAEINNNTDPDAKVAGFIVDADTYVLVAHTTSPAYVGIPTNLVLAKALIPIDEMLAIMAENVEGVWLSYPFPDTKLNILGYERGWFKLHDGYAFAARVNTSPAELSQIVVDEMIRQHHLNPTTVFDIINGFESTSPLYPFVLDPETREVLAHGANPARVGEISVALTNSSVPYETLANLKDGEGIWTEYTFYNPATDMEQPKRSWIKMHDEYLFGSGYYP